MYMYKYINSDLFISGPVYEKCIKLYKHNISSKTNVRTYNHKLHPCNP